MVPQKRDFISRDDAKMAAWTILEGMGVSAKHNERLVEEVDAVVDDIPAADVRPVARGKWKLDSDPGEPWRYVCNICGEKTKDTVMGKPRANYCPNCGARMEES